MGKSKNLGTYTRLEQLFILAIQDILSHSEMNLADEVWPSHPTTKGNIDLLANHPDIPLISGVHLWEMGSKE